MGFLVWYHRVHGALRRARASSNPPGQTGVDPAPSPASNSEGAGRARFAMLVLGAVALGLAAAFWPRGALAGAEPTRIVLSGVRAHGEPVAVADGEVRVNGPDALDLSVTCRPSRSDAHYRMKIVDWSDWSPFSPRATFHLESLPEGEHRVLLTARSPRRTWASD